MKTLASLLLIITGCAVSPDADEDTTGDDGKADASHLAGYFQLTGDVANHEWIETINFHSNGVFEAWMGNDTSNLSGHHFVASGTFAVHNSSMTLKMVASSLTGDTTYDFKLANDVLELEQQGSPDAKFAMHREPLASITFGGDWTVHQGGPLHAGEALLVRYAASRVTCPVLGEDGSDFITTLASVDHGGTRGIVNGYNTEPLNGFYDALGFVPESGHDLAIWFQISTPGCSKFDSNFGNNYHFTITP